MATDTLIELSEAACRAGVSRAVAYRLLFTGQLVGSKRGGRWYVVAGSLRDYLAARPASASAPSPSAA